MRSPTGADASEVRADQRWSFASGVTTIVSRARMLAIHSAAQARSAASSIQAKRLERDGFGGVVRQRAAEIVPVATHGERRRADRAAKIEGEDLGIRVAAELQRHQRQQDRLAGTGRTHHQGMADIADMKRKSKRRRSLGSREEQCRRAQMLVSRGTRPDRRQRNHVARD